MANTSKNPLKDNEVTIGTGSADDQYLTFDNTDQQIEARTDGVINIIATDLELNGVPVGSGTEDIGTPDDGTYDDGFFDWESTTRNANALDNVNELLDKLVDPMAPDLLGSTLTNNLESNYSAYLSANLDPDFYEGFTAGDYVTIFTEIEDVELDSIAFNAGEEGNPIGIITSSRKYGVGGYSTVGIRDLANGVGTTGSLTITDISTYNRIWTSAEAQINYNCPTPGSWKLKLNSSLDGDSAEYQKIFVGSPPLPSFSATATTANNTVVLKKLSGINYYDTGSTFDVNYTMLDMFDPFYFADHLSIYGDYFNTVAGNYSGVPNYNSQLSGPTTITLTSNKTSGWVQGTGSVRGIKPQNRSAVDTFNIGLLSINSYGNVSTTTDERFLDEARRETSAWAAWDPVAQLADGNLQVQNGRMLPGQFGDYGAFSGTVNYYYRVFTPVNGNTQGSILFEHNGFSSFVEEWGGSGKLQIIFTIENNSVYTYDLGRFVGDDDGNTIGVKSNVTNGNTLNWIIPNPPGTGVSSTDFMKMTIKYNGTTATDYITRITTTFPSG